MSTILVHPDLKIGIGIAKKAPVPVRSATLPLSVHEGYAFMDRQGGSQDPEAFVRCRNGDSLDFPALQAMQSGTARPGAGPAGACLHRP
ncbi:MAG: hypothetical protein OXF73_07845, partial [Gammaproteobacteria bacterium]|nr:hypothetical protein [Gammaproteobacteria bacterium]